MHHQRTRSGTQRNVIRTRNRVSKACRCCRALNIGVSQDVIQKKGSQSMSVVVIVYMFVAVRERGRGAVRCRPSLSLTCAAGFRVSGSPISREPPTELPCAVFLFLGFLSSFLLTLLSKCPALGRQQRQGVEIKERSV